MEKFIKLSAVVINDENHTLNLILEYQSIFQERMAYKEYLIEKLFNFKIALENMHFAFTGALILGRMNHTLYFKQCDRKWKR